MNVFAQLWQTNVGFFLFMLEGTIYFKELNSHRDLWDVLHPLAVVCTLLSFERYPMQQLLWEYGYVNHSDSFPTYTKGLVSPGKKTPNDSCNWKKLLLERINNRKRLKWIGNPNTCQNSIIHNIIGTNILNKAPLLVTHTIVCIVVMLRLTQIQLYLKPETFVAWQVNPCHISVYLAAL